MHATDGVSLRTHTAHYATISPQLQLRVHWLWYVKSYWGLARCNLQLITHLLSLRFITPSQLTVLSLRSNFLFRHENQVYTKVKFVQWTTNSKKSSKFKFLILIFDNQKVYFSFLWFARSQQFSIHLKGFENLVKKKDNFHICQGCNQGFGIKRSSINGF